MFISKCKFQPLQNCENFVAEFGEKKRYLTNFRQINRFNLKTLFILHDLSKNTLNSSEIQN